MGGVRHTERSVYSTLSVLDTLKSRKFHSTVRTWQCVTLMGCFIYIPATSHGINRVPCVVVGVSYKTISVGSALLVLLCWAMREPQGVERATSTDLHALFVYACIIRTYFNQRRNWEVDRQSKNILNMLKCSFDVIDCNGRMITCDEMLSVFDIYCLNPSEDVYLLVPHKEQCLNCPLFYVHEEDIRSVFPDGTDGAEFEKLMKQADPSKKVGADRLPSYVKHALFNTLSSCLSYGDK